MVIDLASPAAIEDPHALFHRLRAEAPVHWAEAHRAWLVVSHAGVQAAFRDPALSSERLPTFERLAASQPEGFGAVVDLLRGWMVFRDDPAHDDLRDPVRRAFTPRMIEAMAPAIERITTSLLDAMPSTSGAVVDLRAAFAGPLPALVIAELLGIPAEDRDDFQRWSDLLSQVVFAVDSRHTSMDAAILGAQQFWSYFTELIEQRRRRPGDDLVSALIDSVGEDVLVGACTMLLFAGHETTTGLITNGTRVLLESPAAAAVLQSTPAAWSTAVDELLRMEGPAKLMVRKATADVVIDGVPVPARSTVLLGILAADRDPLVFADPDALDVRRDPNPHLAFGWGIHHCLGAPLARLEARIALRGLFERFPALAKAGSPGWGGGIIGRGTQLSVRVA